MLNIVGKCQPEVMYFNFHSCDTNDHSIVTTLINQADTLNCSELTVGDAGNTYNGVRSLTKLMTVKNVSLIGLCLTVKIEFLTLNMLIGAITLTSSNITTLGLTSSNQSMLTSKHVYHLILLIYQARHLQKLDLSGNFMLAKSVSLLMIAARNVKYLVFKYLLGDQELLDIGLLLQSNTTLECLDIEYFFFRKLILLNHFVSSLKLSQHLNQDHNSRFLLQNMQKTYSYANKGLMTIVKKFCER